MCLVTDWLFSEPLKDHLIQKKLFDNNRLKINCPNGSRVTTCAQQESGCKPFVWYCGHFVFFSSRRLYLEMFIGKNMDFEGSKRRS